MRNSDLPGGHAKVTPHCNRPWCSKGCVQGSAEQEQETPRQGGEIVAGKIGVRNRYLARQSRGLPMLEFRVPDCCRARPDSRYRSLMTKILLLGAAGFVGTLARYFLQGLVQTNAGSAFPFGTLVVNVSGCFALGLFNGLFTDRFLIDPQWRICFTIGFCGAFTTFSTLVFETVQLASGRELFLAAANVIASLALGFIFLWLGIVAARAL